MSDRKSVWRNPSTYIWGAAAVIFGAVGAVSPQGQALEAPFASAAAIIGQKLKDGFNYVAFHSIQERRRVQAEAETVRSAKTRSDIDLQHLYDDRVAVPAEMAKYGHEKRGHLRIVYAGSGAPTYNINQRGRLDAKIRGIADPAPR